MQPSVHYRRLMVHTPTAFRSHDGCGIQEGGRFMASLTSHSKILRDWEALLAATQEKAGVLPGTESLRTELEQLLAEAKALKARQATANAERQRLTQQVGEVFRKGQDGILRLRRLIPRHLVLRAEGLVEVGVPPLRPRPGRSSKPVLEPPKPQPTPVTPQSGADRAG